MDAGMVQPVLEVFVAGKNTDFRSILELDSELNRIQDVDILLERILLEARKVVHADAGSIYEKVTVEENGRKLDKLAIKFAQNNTTDADLPVGQKPVMSFFSVPINEKTISGYVGLTKKPVNVPDMYHIPEGTPYSFNPSFDKLSGYKTISSLTFPLVTAKGDLLGVIQMLNAKDGDDNTIPFTEDDELLIVHFASTATTVLERALDKQEMLLRMNKLAEMRDPKETGTHVKRVAGYTAEIYYRWAFHHNVSEKERERFCDTLKTAAMLHDLGTVAISDVILKKPARFTPEEYEIMKTHTVEGAGIFSNIRSDTDQMALDIALTHHENWDGTGYPGWVDPFKEGFPPLKADAEGKAIPRKGEEIPLTGRIVALADVFDALCSKRVYKEPWDEEQVLEELRKMSGSKFEPELVDCFFEALPSIKQIQSMYPEH
jgi:HD-GYP domain-containing protein (c-di-GMP phosphodiesterase class II)